MARPARTTAASIAEIDRLATMVDEEKACEESQIAEASRPRLPEPVKRRCDGRRVG